MKQKQRRHKIEYSYWAYFTKGKKRTLKRYWRRGGRRVRVHVSYFIVSKRRSKASVSTKPARKASGKPAASVKLKVPPWREYEAPETGRITWTDSFSYIKKRLEKYGLDSDNFFSQQWATGGNSPIDTNSLAWMGQPWRFLYDEKLKLSDYSGPRSGQLVGAEGYCWYIVTVPVGLKKWIDRDRFSVYAMRRGQQDIVDIEDKRLEKMQESDKSVYAVSSVPVLWTAIGKRGRNALVALTVNEYAKWINEIPPRLRGTPRTGPVWQVVFDSYMENQGVEVVAIELLCFTMLLAGRGGDYDPHVKNPQGRKK